MNESMEAEFDTVARWTAEVAIDLGVPYHLPAACRGSGGPAALQWLLERLGAGPADRMLDCGAGVGGPAAFAQQRTGARLVLSDPEAGACTAATRLFGLPTVRAASQLPFGTAVFDVVWSLGVLCTVADQQLLLAEMRRVLRLQGRIGLLVYVAQHQPLSRQPQGNNFPTVDRLGFLVGKAGFEIQDTAMLAELHPPSREWTERAHAVEAELARRHRGDARWEQAAGQSRRVGELLHSGQIAGTLLVATVAPDC